MIQEPAHAVTGIWDVVRELMPVLTFTLMGLATYFLNRLNKGQRAATSAASDAATSASHAATAASVAASAAGNAAVTANASALSLAASAERRETKLDQVVGTVQANNVIAGETHALVNGQRSEMQARIDALSAQLRAAGVEPQ